MSSIKTAWETLVTINPGTTIQGVAAGSVWATAPQDWTTNSDLDFGLQVQIKTGTGALAGSKTVNIYVAASLDGVTWPDKSGVLGLAEGVVTLDSLSNVLQCGRPITVANTATIYASEPASIVSCFGGFTPKKFQVLLENQTGAAWDATNTNFLVKLLGQYATAV